MEEALVFRNERKRILTRHVNTLTRLLVGKELDGVIVGLPPMKRAFEELEDAHYYYLDMFETYDSDMPSDDVNQCKQWFIDVSKSYLDVISKARNFLEQRGVRMTTVWLSVPALTDPMLPETGVKLTATGVRSSVSVHLSDLEVKNVVSGADEVPKCEYDLASEVNEDNDSTQSLNVVTGTVDSCMTGNRVYLPLVTVLVNGHEPAVALLDTGSTNTFITEILASKLSLQGKPVPCRLSTLGSNVNLMTKHVTFDVSPLNDNVTFNVQNVCVIPDIPADVPADGISLDDYPHLAGLPLSPVTNAKVDLLIGQDQPDLLVPLEICRSVNKAGQPYATRTELGWALQGAVDDQIGCKACMMTNDIESETESTLSWSGEDQTVYDRKQGKTELQCNMHTAVFPWRPGRLLLY